MPFSHAYTDSNLTFSQCPKNSSLLPCYSHMQRLGLLIKEQEMLLLKGPEGARRSFGPLLQEHSCPHPACVIEEIFSDLLRYCLLGSECSTFPPKKITLYLQVVTRFLFDTHIFAWNSKKRNNVPCPKPGQPRVDARQSEDHRYVLIRQQAGRGLEEGRGKGRARCG